MYLEFFGLLKPPFRITPDTHLFFEGSDRGAILQALIYAIITGEGIIKVVGEVGVGKTMLCRMLPSKVGSYVEWVYLAHPNLSPDQVLHEIAREMSLAVNDKMDKLQVMRLIQTALLERYVQNKRVVILVEEAQEMPRETMEELRLLSNLETDEHKLLQIVMFGQPELDEKLASRKIRQLRERITHSFHLTPLALTDIHAYLNFRIRAAGYVGPDLFTMSMAKSIENYSYGLIRRINILADKALLAAYAQNTHTLSLRDVRKAAADSCYRKKRFWWPWTHVANFILVLMFTQLSSVPISDTQLLTGDKQMNINIEMAE